MTASMTTSDVLEALYRARASVSDEGERFNYGLWTQCTCGHIYRATLGRPAFNGAEVHLLDTDPDPSYGHVIVEVARALGWEPNPKWPHRAYAADAVAYVSDRTTRAMPNPDRWAALDVVNEAITVIEAEQERDRLAMLAQASVPYEEAMA